MKFDQIPGFYSVKNKLIAMYNQKRIGHAMTFVGEQGSAGLALSIAFAQYINCKKPGENDSCGICSSCVKLEKLSHPDVHFYFPTTTSPDVPQKALSSKYYEKWRAYLNNNLFPTLPSWINEMDSSKKDAIISTEESLQVIKDLALKGYESEARFAIIWLPEKMNVHSSNRLLKIIEEPPKHVYFFLITENPELVLQTILSRTQTLRLGKLYEEEMSEWLKKLHPDVEADRLNNIIKLSDGNPLKALSLFENLGDSNEISEKFIAWARLCYKAYEKMPDLINFSEALSGLQRDEQNKILSFGIDFFRNSLVYKSKAENLLLSQNNDMNHIINFSPLLNFTNSSALIKSFEMAIGHLGRYANAKILFLDLSLDFARNINVKNVHL